MNPNKITSKPNSKSLEKRGEEHAGHVKKTLPKVEISQA
jgi:hypothetical protein